MNEIKVKDEVFRTLFIGLGGTGGEVLAKLLELMKKLPETERQRAHMIYLDTDKGCTDRFKATSVPTVHIGSSDTVRDIINYLGPDDGVLDWVSAEDNDNEFLSSKTDDGASQFRLKSRLCLAKFLNQGHNELERLLDEVSVPGSPLVKETLRVMIVSSIAGGTGAGTFVQVALYLREYFRKNGHKDISIMGLFACPDLFARTAMTEAGDMEKIENMYSNAYAAVRELNAMNLVTSRKSSSTEDGYGNCINISIDTESEGLLFDSKNPLFSSNTNYKPYNLLYFVDTTNTSGGILRTLDQYYGVMADIVFTRLYSPMEEDMRSDESNELAQHQKYPTAIYGSAGYGKIVYPYDGILDYLSVRKTYDELDYTWSQLENEWAKYKRNQILMAKASGRRWSASSAERGERFISDMNDSLSKTNSKLRSIAGMIRTTDSAYDRAEEYLARLDKALSSASGLEANPEAKDSLYGLSKDPDVFNTRKKMAALYVSKTKDIKSLKESSDIINRLKDFSSSASSNMQSYVSDLTVNAAGRAQYVASVVAPRNAQDGIVASTEKDPLNLYYGLLAIDGVAVHPLAARYLLYRLRQKMVEKINANKEKSARQRMLGLCRDLNLVFDSNPNDNNDITVDIRVKELEKTFFLWRAGEAKAALDKYIKKYEDTMSEMMREATRNLTCELYTRVLEVVDILIEKYEGLFDNLEQYKTELGVKVNMERDRHEASSDDRCIFINASREAKEYCYTADLRTRDVLDSGNDEISAAAGKGIYDALIKRTWEALESAEMHTLTDGFTEEVTDTYSDLGDVFENIVKLYRSYLKQHAAHLNNNVVRALILECCRNAGLTEAELVDPEKRAVVRNLFEQVVFDMVNKAEPMLNFSRNNSSPYFVDEKNDSRAASSTLYMHIGLNPVATNELCRIYTSNNAAAAVGEFVNKFQPDRGLSQSDAFELYEMVCFKAAHCLQPTQIWKFREDYNHGYYHYYMKRLANMNATKCFSFTPHLDKRWHLREAMPYISKELDAAWHRKAARAFVYEMLYRKLCFTSNDEGTICFNYVRKGKEQVAYVRWPGSKLITVSEISRLIEYLQEQDERVDTINAQFDEMLEELIERVSKHTDNLPVYKAALTTNLTLKDLRSNLLVKKQRVSTLTPVRGKKDVSSSGATEKEVEAFKKAYTQLGITEADMMDTKKSLGGLFEVAWLVHKSEEKQNRDHDFGEYVVKCGLEIIEKLCTAMCGTRITEGSEEHEMYNDLRMSIIEKFMESYVISILGKLKLFDDGELKKLPSKVFYRYLKVPEIVTGTEEYSWITDFLELN